jgi:hypothetical protein
MIMDEILWYLQISFDRNVANPKDILYSSAIIHNPNYYPIYIASCHWWFNCYPDAVPGTKQMKKIIPPNGWEAIPSWELPIPEIQEGQYQAMVSLDTWKWDVSNNLWIDLGTINPNRAENFFIIQNPRFRAFVSRSNRLEDRPIVEPIISQIQKWGFDTHTVGINEIELDKGKVPERIIDEIVKSDCIIAIATPREKLAISNFYNTLTWLHNEVSFAFMDRKLILLIAHNEVKLDGLIGSDKIPVFRYDPNNLANLIQQINNLFPQLRKYLIEETYQKWKQETIEQIERIKMESFIMGVIAQKRLSLDG